MAWNFVRVMLQGISKGRGKGILNYLFLRDNGREGRNEWIAACGDGVDLMTG